MSAYAVCRIKKLKISNLAAVGNHNMRTMPVKHRDPSGQFHRIIGEKNKTTEELVNEKLNKFVKNKIRKDATVAVEFVLSASPEYFRPKNPGQWGQYEQEKVDKWVKKTTDFLIKTYGKQRIADVCLHLDEATPHIHAVIVPLERKQLKKRRTKEQIKNNIPAETYEAVTLNARDNFDRTKLSELQTEYASAIESLGIMRGVRHSRAKNKPLIKYYSEIENSQDKSFKIDIPVIEKPPMFNAAKWAEKKSNEVTKAFTEQEKAIKKLQLLANQYKARYENERAKTEYVVKELGTVDSVRERITDLEALNRSLKCDMVTLHKSHKLKYKKLENELQEVVGTIEVKDKAFKKLSREHYKLKDKYEPDNDLTY
tara:strand:+ start:37 stop:1146 length:1110 start_codon:yes stop_codon:yes gene_type:complete